MNRIGMYFLRTSWLITVVFGLWFSAYAETTGSGPVVVINERTFDFKEVKEGASLEHTFSVLNKGDQDLEIKKVKPT